MLIDPVGRRELIFLLSIAGYSLLSFVSYLLISFCLFFAVFSFFQISFPSLSLDAYVSKLIVSLQISVDIKW